MTHSLLETKGGEENKGTNSVKHNPKFTRSVKEIKIKLKEVKAINI